MVFMFIDDQDHEYTPVVLDLDVTANNGFKIMPYIVGDSVYFTTLGDGEVWYFYARTDDVVASYEFEEMYDDADEYGYKSASAGVLNGFELEDEDYLEDYPYIVLAFLPEEYENKDDKKFSYPVVLDVEDAAASGSAISVDKITDEEVWITAGVDGRVYYYFTDSSTNPGTKFEDKYDAAKKGSSERCDENEEIDIDVEDVGYDYLVICIAVTDGSDTVYLAPVVVDLANRTSGEGDEDDGSTTNATGLKVTDHDFGDHIITFTALDSGEVTVTLTAGSFKTTCGTVSVTEDEEYDFDYDSFVSNDIVDFIIQTNGTGAKITLQLVSSDGKETYRSVSYDVIQ